MRTVLSSLLLAAAVVAAGAGADPAQGPSPAPAAAPEPQAPDCSERMPIGGIGSWTEDLARVAELTGAAPVRPEVFRRWSSTTEVTICRGGRAPHPSQLPPPLQPRDLQVEATPLSWRTYLNSGYPDDRNDGALWEGRGISTEATGGVRLRWRFFSAGFIPTVAWQQNRDFPRPPMTTPGYSTYANPFYNSNGYTIDYPLRFGPTDFWTFDPGQSYARIDLWNVAFGFSTENMWWGPGIRNSILMTNSAPGFPHLFLGTSHPQDIWLGWLEVQLVWGRLRESKWFDTDPTDDRRHFTSLNVGFEPKWIPGLFVGANRVYLYRIPPGGLDFGRTIGEPLFNPFFKDALANPNDPTGDSSDNQLFSLFARWVFPASGLEIYGEWGRDDHSWNFRDFITQPSHSQAFMLGLQKVFPVGEGWIRFVGEYTQTLEEPTNNPPRGVPIFYTHGSWGEPQGYTNDGQMLGAGIGPAADSQFVAVDWFHSRGRAGVWFERVLRNDRYFYDNIHRMFAEDTEIAAGLRGVWSWRELDLDASLGLGHRYNMDFMTDANSWKGMLAFTWWPGRSAIPALPAPTSFTGGTVAR